MAGDVQEEEGGSHPRPPGTMWSGHLYVRANHACTLPIMCTSVLPPLGDLSFQYNLMCQEKIPTKQFLDSIMPLGALQLPLAGAQVNGDVFQPCFVNIDDEEERMFPAEVWKQLQSHLQQKDRIAIANQHGKTICQCTLFLFIVPASIARTFCSFDIPESQCIGIFYWAGVAVPPSPEPTYKEVKALDMDHSSMTDVVKVPDSSDSDSEYITLGENLKDSSSREVPTLPTPDEYDTLNSSPIQAENCENMNESLTNRANEDREPASTSESVKLDENLTGANLGDTPQSEVMVIIDSSNPQSQPMTDSSNLKSQAMDDSSNPQSQPMTDSSKPKSQAINESSTEDTEASDRTLTDITVLIKSTDSCSEDTLTTTYAASMDSDGITDISSTSLSVTDTAISSADHVKIDDATLSNLMDLQSKDDSIAGDSINANTWDASPAADVSSEIVVPASSVPLVSDDVQHMDSISSTNIEKSEKPVLNCSSEVIETKKSCSNGALTNTQVKVVPDVEITQNVDDLNSLLVDVNSTADIVDLEDMLDALSAGDAHHTDSLTIASGNTSLETKTPIGISESCVNELRAPDITATKNSTVTDSLGEMKDDKGTSHIVEDRAAGNRRSPGIEVNDSDHSPLAVTEPGNRCSSDVTETKDLASPSVVIHSGGLVSTESQNTLKGVVKEDQGATGVVSRKEQDTRRSSIIQGDVVDECRATGSNNSNDAPKMDAIVTNLLKESKAEETDQIYTDGKIDQEVKSSKPTHVADVEILDKSSPASITTSNDEPFSGLIDDSHDVDKVMTTSCDMRCREEDVPGTTEVLDSVEIHCTTQDDIVETEETTEAANPDQNPICENVPEVILATRTPPEKLTGLGPTDDLNALTPGDPGPESLNINSFIPEEVPSGKLEHIMCDDSILERAQEAIDKLKDLHVFQLKEVILRSQPVLYTGTVERDGSIPGKKLDDIENDCLLLADNIGISENITVSGLDLSTTVRSSSTVRQCSEQLVKATPGSETTRDTNPSHQDQVQATPGSETIRDTNPSHQDQVQATPGSETIRDTNPSHQDQATPGSETIRDTNPSHQDQATPGSETIRDTNPSHQDQATPGSETIRDTNPSHQDQVQATPGSETIRDTNPSHQDQVQATPGSETIRDTNPSHQEGIHQHWAAWVDKNVHIVKDVLHSINSMGKQEELLSSGSSKTAALSSPGLAMITMNYADKLVTQPEDMSAILRAPYDVVGGQHQLEGPLDLSTKTASFDANADSQLKDHTYVKHSTKYDGRSSGPSMGNTYDRLRPTDHSYNAPFSIKPEENLAREKHCNVSGNMSAKSALAEDICNVTWLSQQVACSYKVTSRPAPSHTATSHTDTHPFSQWPTQFPLSNNGSRSEGSTTMGAGCSSYSPIVRPASFHASAAGISPFTLPATQPTWSGQYWHVEKQTNTASSSMWSPYSNILLPPKENVPTHAVPGDIPRPSLHPGNLGKEKPTPIHSTQRQHVMHSDISPQSPLLAELISSWEESPTTTKVSRPKWPPCFSTSPHSPAFILSAKGTDGEDSPSLDITQNKSKSLPGWSRPQHGDTSGGSFGSCEKAFTVAHTGPDEENAPHKKKKRKRHRTKSNEKNEVRRVYLVPAAESVKKEPPQDTTSAPATRYPLMTHSLNTTPEALKVSTQSAVSIQSALELSGPKDPKAILQQIVKEKSDSRSLWPPSFSTDPDSPTFVKKEIGCQYTAVKDFMNSGPVHAKVTRLTETTAVTSYPSSSVCSHESKSDSTKANVTSERQTVMEGIKKLKRTVTVKTQEKLVTGYRSSSIPYSVPPLMQPYVFAQNPYGMAVQPQPPVSGYLIPVQQGIMPASIHPGLLPTPTTMVQHQGLIPSTTTMVQHPGLLPTPTTMVQFQPPGGGPVQVLVPMPGYIPRQCWAVAAKQSGTEKRE